MGKVGMKSGEVRWKGSTASMLIYVAFVAAFMWARPAMAADMSQDSWSDKWCELNDCYGVEERRKNQQTIDYLEREQGKVTRR